MEQRLALPGPALEVATPAVAAHLRYMPANGPPALDLPFIIGTAAAQEIAAIPLKPAARVFLEYPTLLAPDGERLRCVDAEEIQFRIMPIMAKFGLGEPIGRKFRAAIGHVLASKYAEREYLLWRKFGVKVRMKMLADGLHREIGVALLHQIMNLNPKGLHLILRA